jgi:hypothetical protein
VPRAVREDGEDEHLGVGALEETNDNGQASSLAVTLAGLGVAVVFEALTVLATHDKTVRAVSPWQDDPYDVALSHSQFAVPMLAAVIALRLLAWRAPGGQDRARQVRVDPGQRPRFQPRAPSCRSRGS